MPSRLALFATPLLLGLFPGPLPASEGAFDATVGPILVRRCLDCHAAASPKGGLNLTTRGSMLTGGDSGPAVVPGKGDTSLLWQRVRDNEMPPRKPLSVGEKEIIRAWIASGANWGSSPLNPARVTTDKRAGPDWWSLRPVRRPTPPAVKNKAWLRSGIDAFVLSQLERRGLACSPEADRRTLIRRLSFDLVGLPPAPEEVDAFVRDADPQAYEKLVERLLAAPHFGERWARHWLDVVRFGESDGFERDLPRRNAWPFRDWVVSAFNRDLPYVEFVRFQLAGDVLRPGDPAALAATGFLVAGPHDIVLPASERMKAAMRQDEMEDLIGTVGQTFLGLTVNCARCHDHKFDPISQRDYYQLAAALAGVDPGERTVPNSAASTPKAPKARREAKSYSVVPRRPATTYLLRRGQVDDRGELLGPAGIAAVPTGFSFRLPADAPEEQRRKSLARWITDRDNPLFARVIVNRLWHYHFGAGLVDSPNDFGFNGGRPSHPALLDWLAAELMRQDWSLKAVHRKIVLSATYRQSSRLRLDAERVDAENRLHARANPRRLEAETIRDSMLTVSGSLDRTMGGMSYFDTKSYFFKGTQFYEPLEQVGHAFHRRTLYRFWARGGRSPFLDTFDCPDPSTTTPRRLVTTTPIQALALLNNAFVIHMADRLGERLQAEAGPEIDRQVSRAYYLAFSRWPAAEEMTRARAFVERHGLPAFCRVLMNSSEFVLMD